jgi:hypothetical protein
MTVGKRKKKSEQTETLLSGLFKELGRHGGTKRMAGLSAKQKTALGKKAAKARWGTKRRAKGGK